MIESNPKPVLNSGIVAGPAAALACGLFLLVLLELVLWRSDPILVGHLRSASLVYALISLWVWTQYPKHSSGIRFWSGQYHHFGSRGHYQPFRRLYRSPPDRHGVQPLDRTNGNPCSDPRRCRRLGLLAAPALPVPSAPASTWNSMASSFLFFGLLVIEAGG